MFDPVVFDLDGTLVDTVHLIMESHRHAVRTVLGRELPDEQLIAQVGRPLIEQMAVFSPGHAQELYDVYRTWNHAHTAELIRAYPGVDALLDGLADAGRTMAVVTSKSRDAVDLAFDAIPGLRERFPVIVCQEDTERHKPHGDPIVAALDRLGRPGPNGACYVGDSPFDLRAARAAGVGSVAVTWGFFAADVLEAESPDLVATTTEDLLEALLRP